MCRSGPFLPGCTALGLAPAPARSGVGSRVSMLWTLQPGPLCRNKPSVPLPGKCPRGRLASGGTAPFAQPQAGGCAPCGIRGSASSTQGSSAPCRDQEEVGAPRLCHPASGGVGLVPLGRRDRGCRRLPFTSSLSSHVPGPQPPCLHPCLLMGPIGPGQERLQVPLIALSLGRTISDTQRMF